MARASESTAKANRPSGRLIGLKTLETEFGIPFWTARRLVLNGDIPLVRLPNVRRLLVDRRDVERCLEAWKERA